MDIRDAYKYPNPPAWMARNGKNLKVSKNKMWVCLYVAPRSEFNFTQDFDKHKIPFFCPVIKDVRKKIYVPYWPNYIFANLTDEKIGKYAVRHKVRKLLFELNQDKLIKELKKVHPSYKYNFKYVEGMKVRITDGGLKGLTAKINKVKKSGEKLKLSVPFMERSIELEYDILNVEAIEKNSEIFEIVPLIEQLENTPGAKQSIDTEFVTIDNEVIHYLKKHPELMYDLNPRKFEEVIADIMSDMGYDTKLTKSTRDGGRDILAVLHMPFGDLLIIVECKRYAKERKVGRSIVERFLYIIREQDRASHGLIVTSSYFTSGAKLLERDYKYQLTLNDFGDLQDWLSKYGTWKTSKMTKLWLPTPLISCDSY